LRNLNFSAIDLYSADKENHKSGCVLGWYQHICVAKCIYDDMAAAAAAS